MGTTDGTKCSINGPASTVCYCLPCDWISDTPKPTNRSPCWSVEAKPSTKPSSALHKKASDRQTACFHPRGRHFSVVLRKPPVTANPLAFSPEGDTSLPLVREPPVTGGEVASTVLTQIGYYPPNPIRATNRSRWQRDFRPWTPSRFDPQRPRLPPPISN